MVLIAVLAGCSAAPGASTDRRPGSTPLPEPGIVTDASPSPTAERTEDPPPRAETTAALDASPPERVRIDALGVDQEIIPLGKATDGSMEVPQAAEPVGWYQYSPTPGQTGPSVLAGHLTWNGVDGIFRNLDTLVVGDPIEVIRADGSTARFAVSRVEQYGKDRFPTARVYGNTEGPELRLITCAGDYDPESRGFSDNVVVYARMLPPS
ncbi:class F sortase [Phytoactinopolyspora halotolerans]|uniref:Class F sortase n=1 Tax=Phytoactinopolyspora halotolerans TaxID=1981512 RepID=A0A6L9S745_9ACTN|nr:class F sortase [Phytoactinopolyspora halotolerans]NEE00996.1 class F sortase [Phytoactinopolyspora halotolerans]